MAAPSSFTRLFATLLTFITVGCHSDLLAPIEPNSLSGMLEIRVYGTALSFAGDVIERRALAVSRHIRID